MIAKITRGSNPGNIGAYLHGPGKANEHQFNHGGRPRPGGVVIGGNLGADGQTEPKIWVKEMRAAMRTRPEIIKPIWQVSLRNTVEDRTLSDAEWRDIGQGFAERMGFDEHPWVMVRHGEDHVHLVVSRVSDAGEVWHGRNDRRAAQAACTALERVYGLLEAPRRRVGAQKRSQVAERAGYRSKAQKLAQDREEVQAVREMMKAMGPMPSFRRGPGPAPSKTYPVRSRGPRQGRGQGLER